MPEASCPLGVWGPHPGEGRRHLARLGGIVAQVRAVIRAARAEFRVMRNRKMP